MKKLLMFFIAFAAFFKADANVKNDFYFSFNPYYYAMDDEYDVSAFGASFGLKGEGETNGYDLGIEAYYTDEKELNLHGQVQYVFYPLINLDGIKPYFGIGINFPILNIYKDFLAFYDNLNDFYAEDISWNEDFMFSVKSTIGITYPLKVLRGFTEFSFMYPTVNGSTLEIYEKENMKLPDAISLKVGILF